MTQPHARDTEPLADAHAIQLDAASNGFDWPDIRGVLEKVHEEIDEIEDALRQGDVAHARAELGDLLFAAVNLSRFLGADPAQELARTNRRFLARYARVKSEVEKTGRPMADHTLEELDVVWEHVKGEERNTVKTLDKRPDHEAHC